MLPGIALTLIWSKSSSPEYSTLTPALNVWRPRTIVVTSLTVWIGPADDAGYGPPSRPLNGVKPVTVGILSSISLLSGKMYG